MTSGLLLSTIVAPILTLALLLSLFDLQAALDAANMPRSLFGIPAWVALASLGATQSLKRILGTLPHNQYLGFSETDLYDLRYLSCAVLIAIAAVTLICLTTRVFAPMPAIDQFCRADSTALACLDVLNSSALRNVIKTFIVALLSLGSGSLAILWALLVRKLLTEKQGVTAPHA